MGNIRESWTKTPKVIKNITSVVAVIVSLAGAYTGLNSAFGTTIRPAWIWELDELSQRQLKTQLGITQINRRESARELARYLAMREEFRRADNPIPSWLTDVIANTEDDLQNIITEIDEVQRKIVESN